MTGPDVFCPSSPVFRHKFWQENWIRKTYLYAFMCCDDLIGSIKDTLTLLRVVQVSCDKRLLKKKKTDKAVELGAGTPRKGCATGNEKNL